jgi:polar amino acid transport system permease protein
MADEAVERQPVPGGAPALTGRDDGPHSWLDQVQGPGRWLARIIIAVLAAMLVHLLLTSRTIQWRVVWQYFSSKLIIEGAERTVELTVLAMAIGITIGITLALMRLSRSLLIRQAAGLYIWFFRGTPLLVQVVFWFNLSSFIQVIGIGIPFGPTFVSANVNSLVTPFVAALLGLGLNEGAYMSEVVRAGILSVDTGQAEASLALGMSESLTMRRVVFPQAMRVIIPPTGNQAIGMLKSSSLVSVTALPELLYSAQSIYARTFQTIPLLIVASLWYLILTTVLSVGQFYIERYFGRGSSKQRLPPTLLEELRAPLRRLLAFGGRDAT